MYRVTHKKALTVNEMKRQFILDVHFYNHGQTFLNFKTKKGAIDFLKQIYLQDHVPFFELDCHGKSDGFSFKEFLNDFTIIKNEK